MIFPPPIDTAPAGLVVLAGVAAAGLGIVLLLWGRLVHRVALMLVAGAVAFWLSPPLADRLGVNVQAVRGAAALAAAVAACVLARVAWAVLAAGLAALVVAWAVLPCLPADLGQPWPSFAETDSLDAWLAELGRHLAGVLELQWGARPVLLAGGAGLAVLVPLLVFLLRPRLGAIVMTSLLGSAGLVVGTLAALGRLAGPIWLSAWRYVYVVGALIGLLLVVGVVVQYRSALAAQAAAKAKADADDKGQSKPARNADKK